MLRQLSLAFAAAGLISVPAWGARSAPVSYHMVKIGKLDLFYREAGDPSLPALVLLHGRQTSSHMYRDLIPLLSTRYHLIAPDLPGFGQSSTPALTDFPYTFAGMAEAAQSLIDTLGIRRFGLMMQDYGVPIGFRIAAASPRRITKLIVQNGVICDPAVKVPLWLEPFWSRRDPAAEQRLRNSFSLQTTIKYYKIGAASEERVSPDAIALSQYYLDLPGRRDAQVELMHDFPSNVASYPAWQSYLRLNRPPTLVLWGKDSPVYSPDQANCYKEANPRAIVRLFSGGHFMIEERPQVVAEEILRFTTGPYRHRRKRP